MLKRFKGFAAIGVNNFDIVEIVRDYLADGDARKTDGFKEKVLPKKIKYNKYVDIVPISEGCMGQCTYCATWLARGKLRSYEPARLLAEIADSVSSGAKEIWLTSQDNGCYGFDRGTNLVELLEEVVKIPGDFKIRVGMMNPSYVKMFLDELIEVYKSPKIFKFAHIPVQSGSDKVLKDMGRAYTAKDFEETVAAFRNAMGITISTDIIVGFPTEMKKDFEETVELLKRVKPDFLNLSKYWPRKGTRANDMKQLSRDIIAARSKKVAELYSKMLKEKNKKLVGQTCNVIFTEERNDFSIGRNERYQPVLVKGGGLLGKTRSVKISASRKSELVGELV